MCVHARACLHTRVQVNGHKGLIDWTQRFHRQRPSCQQTKTQLKIPSCQHATYQAVQSWYQPPVSLALAPHRADAGRGTLSLHLLPVFMCVSSVSSVCACVCRFLRACVCVDINKCIYTHTHIRVHTHGKTWRAASSRSCVCRALSCAWLVLCRPVLSCHFSRRTCAVHACKQLLAWGRSRRGGCWSGRGGCCS